MKTADIDPIFDAPDPLVEWCRSHPEQAAAKIRHAYARLKVFEQKAHEQSWIDNPDRRGS